MLPKKFRLTKSGSFSYVYRSGSCTPSKLISLNFVKSKGNAKIGFSIPNKVGKAVKRNLLKRRMRAIIREFLPLFISAQIVLSAKLGAAELSFLDLRAVVVDLLCRAKLLKNNEKEIKH